MNKLINQAREQLGWQGLAGVALLLVAWGFLNFALNPLEQETAQLSGNADLGHSNSGGYAGGSGGSQEDLETFFDSLPREKSITDVLAKIDATAEAAHVSFKQADYTLDNKDSPLVEYVIDFPVKGEYPQIRAFLSSVLAGNPAMALDQVSIRRDKIGESILNANIKLTLFLRPSQ